MKSQVALLRILNVFNAVQQKILKLIAMIKLYFSDGYRIKDPSTLLICQIYLIRSFTLLPLI